VSNGSGINDYRQTFQTDAERPHRRVNSDDDIKKQKSTRDSLSSSPHRRSQSTAGRDLGHARSLRAQTLSDFEKSLHSHIVSSNIAEKDLDLARKMQELEDMGLGRLNSERELDIDKIDPEPCIKDNIVEMKCSNAESLIDDEELARLIRESAVDFNEVSDDVLRELLGPSAKERLKLAGKSTNIHGSHTTSNLDITPSSINALRAVLSGVDHPKDVTSRVARTDTNHSATTNKPVETFPNPATPTRQARTVAAPKGSGGLLVEFPSARGLSNSSLQQVETAPAISPSRSKKKRRSIFGFGSIRQESDDNTKETRALPDSKAIIKHAPTPGAGGIPAAIPPPPDGSLSVPPNAAAATRNTRSISPPRGPPSAIPPKPFPNQSINSRSVCFACGLSHGTFLKVLENKYHADCFRCKSCSGKIATNDQFIYAEDEDGTKQPHHRECFVGFGLKCTVCKDSIPATPDGRVPFVKHPFFERELMCLRHVENPHRRCSSCQRFQPQDTPFIDLMDSNRYACPACFRSVLVDSEEIIPLWRKLMEFYEKKLQLPVWGQMRDVPIVMVGSDALNDQIRAQRRGCTDCNMHTVISGCTIIEEHPKIEVVGLLCLTALPRDLAASVLAHQSAHIWIKLHPKFTVGVPLPPQVEEGVAQLIAMLFISEGLGPSAPMPPSDVPSSEPSDEKLRKYFKFLIEREKSEIFGTGFQKAMKAYRDIGMEMLLTHILQYRDFPIT
jgi:hypothetical protein